MSAYIIGFIAGIMITLFCIFCIDAAAKNSRITDAEMEAWEEHLRERHGSVEVPLPDYPEPPPPTKQPDLR